MNTSLCSLFSTYNQTRQKIVWVVFVLDTEPQFLPKQTNEFASKKSKISNLLPVQCPTVSNYLTLKNWQWERGFFLRNGWTVNYRFQISNKITLEKLPHDIHLSLDCFCNLKECLVNDLLRFNLSIKKSSDQKLKQFSVCNINIDNQTKFSSK